MLTKSEVDTVIDREVSFQSSKWGSSHDRGHDVGSFILLLEEYADKARKSWVGNSGDYAALQQVVKIAALAHNCLEGNGIKGLTAR
jgi:hypothetical protein